MRFKFLFRTKAFLKYWFAIIKKGEIVSSNALQKPPSCINFIRLWVLMNNKSILNKNFCVD